MSEDVVWSSMLDHRYRVTVTRTASYQGELTIAEDGRRPTQGNCRSHE